MSFTAQYANSENTVILRSDMPSVSIPADPANRHYAEIIEAGMAIAAYVAPPAFPTAEAAIVAMVNWIEGLHAKITGPVPQDVKFGWKAKADWARAWDADNSVATPQTILDELTAAGDIYANQQALVSVIIVKANLYEGVIADTDGLRSKTQDLIEAEATKPSPDLQQYGVILAAAQAQALTMLQGRGISLAP